MNTIVGIYNNFILWVAVLAWAVAQLIKILLELRRTRKLNLHLIISSGGMPSSHTSFVTAMTTGVGLTEGFNSAIFAVSAIVSLVVMYDAAGVRRAAGKQAEVLNMFIETFESQGVKVDKRLKELLGHTPVEVAAGAVLGVLLAVVMIRAF